MNTWVKETQQVNPGGPDKQSKHQAPTISSIDTSLSQNHQRVWSPTHRRAMKEESSVANLDWVDHQACSLLQYIYVILIKGFFFIELHWNFFRADNLLQFIYQVTIEFWFRKSFAQEKFKTHLEFRYQIIVLSIKFRNIFAKFMIPIALLKKFLS